MYGEYIDLSWRVEESGYKNYYWPYSIIHYKGESTTKESYKYVRVFYGAMGIFFRKHSKEYSFLSRSLVYSGLYLQTYLKLSIVFARKTINKLYQRKEKSPYFLIFSSSELKHDIQNILNNNGLGECCHFVEHINDDYIIDSNTKITHMVYDKDLFTYEDILNKHENNNEHKLQLGVYNSYLKAIITPGECYT